MPLNTFLMRSYPKIKRDTSGRSKQINDEIRQIARKFDKEFFDGDRLHGYGGYHYDGRWKPVVRDFIAYYNLSNNSKILDIGAGKGFMMRDFMEALPSADIKGIDISEYAVNNCEDCVKNSLFVGNAKKLEFEDDQFDLVISINTIHNLELIDLKASLKEIKRVSRKNIFLVLDSWRTDEEKKRIYEWNLTAKTILSEKEWIKLFKEINFECDYDWFIP